GADRSRLGGVRRQFAFAAAAAVGLVLACVLIAAALMFVSSHDALLASGVAVAAGVIAVRTATLLAGGVAADVIAIRDALVAVGEGRRDVGAGVAARDELGELGRAADAMARRLADEEARRKAADGARRTLVAAVSHDLRTPVTALRLLVEAIEDDIVDVPTRRRYLATMQSHIRALSTMIDDLFELSRIEAGDVAWSIRSVELAGLLDETVEAIAVEARAKGVRVSTELPNAPLAARADPERVQRALLNLIRNAIRHTPSDGSVVVRAAATAAAVEIEVADTGDGIRPGDRERIFEPFYRGGGDAARGAEGAGLGLAIARAIVERHGGRIWLPASERGARVRFTLPPG
ncbi:MAG TPA: HAMP domain-containing sensor histidine kinase, partial [Solirubrobacteraceae bacterium]|nr:HAMP domain-containing sensor histidine kinase [Solirubrobacteraceae bacterium]